MNAHFEPLSGIVRVFAGVTVAGAAKATTTIAGKVNAVLNGSANGVTIRDLTVDITGVELGLLIYDGICYESVPTIRNGIIGGGIVH